MKRRDALSRLSGLLALAVLRPADFRPPRFVRKPFDHPDPRPGITGEHVIADADLPKDKKKMHAAYDDARTYPELFDGVYCVCDCRESLAHRSLLACFESKQPTGCLACQSEAELIAKLAKEGKCLEEIRAAIDKKWG
jgi:hypothetical protein